MDMKATQIGIVLVTCMCLLGQSPWSWAAPPQRDATLKVYVDESRSLQLGAQIWFGLPGDFPLRLTRGRDLIAPEHLARYDVMIVWNQVESIAYSQEELAAVDAFVRNGGGLLLIGTPSPHTRDRARFAKQKFVDMQPLPMQDFSSNMLAGLFGPQFSNASRNDVPQFVTGTPLTDGPDLEKIACRQPLSPLAGSLQDTQILLEYQGYPLIVAKQHGKGRVIICGASRLFLRLGTLADAKLHKIDDQLAAQENLLMQWLLWLAQDSPVRSESARDLPARIPGRVCLKSDGLVIYTIPQLQSTAEQLVNEWAKVWPRLSHMTGLTSPVELVRDMEQGTPLEVYLIASPSGGLSAGDRITIPAMGGGERLIGVLSHEVGHKLLGGCNHGASEAFAEWCSIKGLAAAGYQPFADDKFAAKIKAFRDEDPTGNRLNLNDATAEISQSQAFQGKWFYIFSQLEQKHGETFLADYLKSLRTNVDLCAPARKRVDDKDVQITMADHVQAMSQAAGEDLTGWFQSMGVMMDQ